MRLLIFVLFFPLFINGQNLVDFNQERLNTDKKLMLTLGGWAAANILVGSYGWATTKNEAQAFHQMNVMWSGVNLALAIPGYFKAKNTDASEFKFSKTLKEQIKTEKVFLFNTALDLFYISGGFYLKQRALLDTENYHRYRGWGNSLILQGGFLFLFDLTAVLIHSKHRHNKLDGLLNNLTLSDNGFGLKYQFNKQQRRISLGVFE